MGNEWVTNGICETTVIINYRNNKDGEELRRVDHLLEELFFQLVSPPLVCFLVSCQVANVCTLQQHLQAYRLGSHKQKSLRIRAAQWEGLYPGAA